MATITTPGARMEATDGISILLEASEAAAANSLDLDALLVELSKLVGKIVDYELYALLLPTEDGHLRIAHSVGFPEEVVQSLRVPLGSGLTGRAVVTKATVLVDDVDLDPAYLRAVDCVRSELAVPLVARDRVVAVLDLQSGGPAGLRSSRLGPAGTCSVAFLAGDRSRPAVPRAREAPLNVGDAA